MGWVFDLVIVTCLPVVAWWLFWLVCVFAYLVGDCVCGCWVLVVLFIRLCLLSSVFGVGIWLFALVVGCCLCLLWSVGLVA